MHWKKKTISNKHGLGATKGVLLDGIHTLVNVNVCFAA